MPIPSSQLSEATAIRQNKYLNNPVEQDHRNIKRLVRPDLGFGSFHTAHSPLKGYEAMAMIRKEQIKGIDRDDVTGPILFVHEIVGITA